jgi:hypothetical protein
VLREAEHRARSSEIPPDPPSERLLFAHPHGLACGKR